jgi:hypothetical protein
VTGDGEVEADGRVKGPTESISQASHGQPGRGGPVPVGRPGPAGAEGGHHRGHHRRQPLPPAVPRHHRLTVTQRPEIDGAQRVDRSNQRIHETAP